VVINKVNEKLNKLLATLEEYIDREDLTLKEVNNISGTMTKILQVLSSNAFKEKEFELRGGDVDFTNPKIQKAFYFIVEVFIDSIDEAGVDENTKRQILDKLSFNLIGFEEKLNKTLKGVKLPMIDQLVNPLAKKVIDDTKK